MPTLTADNPPPSARRPTTSAARRQAATLRAEQKAREKEEASVREAAFKRRSLHLYHKARRSSPAAMRTRGMESTPTALPDGDGRANENDRQTTPSVERPSSGTKRKPNEENLPASAGSGRLKSGSPMAEEQPTDAPAPRPPVQPTGTNTAAPPAPAAPPSILRSGVEGAVRGGTQRAITPGTEGLRFKESRPRTSPSSEGLRVKIKPARKPTPDTTSMGTGGKKKSGGSAARKKKHTNPTQPDTATPREGGGTRAGGGIREVIRPEFTESIFVEFKANIPPRTDDVEGKFKAMMGEMLSLMQDDEEDTHKCACICHTRKTDGKRIYTKGDFAKRFSAWGTSHFHLDSENSFMSATRHDRGRGIRGSMKLGMGENARGYVMSLRVDLKKIGLEIYYKDLQHLDTRSKIALVFVPIAIPVDHIKTMAMRLLGDLEERVSIEQPERFPWRAKHRDLPETVCKIDWAKGTPWRSKPAEKPGTIREDTSNRKVPTFTYRGSDEERLIALVRECKKQGLERTVFGDQAHFMIMPADQSADSQKVEWEKILRIHGSYQESLGKASLHGLVNPDYKVQVELLNDANGPRQSPGKMSVRDIMMKIRRHKDHIWQCLAPDWYGEMVGYFPGTDPHCIEHAEEISTCLASYIYIYLRRRGWAMASIKKLIKHSFDTAAADSATKAKYDSKNKCVIPGTSGRQGAGDLERIAGCDWIDMDLGLTKEERAANAKHHARASARRGMNLPQLNVGSFGAFEFGEMHSQDTLNTKKPRGNTEGQAYTLGEESGYSFSTSGEEDASAAGDEKEVEFELPGDIMEADEEDGDNNSEVSNITPVELDARMGDTMAANTATMDTEGQQEDVDDNVSKEATPTPRNARSAGRDESEMDDKWGVDEYDSSSSDSSASGYVIDLVSGDEGDRRSGRAAASTCNDDSEAPIPGETGSVQGSIFSSEADEEDCSLEADDLSMDEGRYGDERSDSKGNDEVKAGRADEQGVLWGWDDLEVDSPKTQVQLDKEKRERDERWLRRDDGETEAHPVLRYDAEQASIRAEARRRSRLTSEEAGGYPGSATTAREAEAMAVPPRPG